MVAPEFKTRKLLPNGKNGLFLFYPGYEPEVTSRVGIAAFPANASRNSQGLTRPCPRFITC